MTTTKVLVSTGVSAAVLAGSLLAVTAVSAAEQSTREDRRNEHISALSERFNLNEEEVRSFYEEQREIHRAEREQKRAQHIQSLVEDGTLTQEQADQLESFREEMHELKVSLRESGASRDEIKEQIESSKEEIKSWAETEGINLETIKPERAERGFGKYRN
jgi:molecular chaperone DnaK (HSP70)